MEVKLLKLAQLEFEDAMSRYELEQAGLGDRFRSEVLRSISRILVVVHCERGGDEEELRIISARKATSSERQYDEGDPS